MDFSFVTGTTCFEYDSGNLYAISVAIYNLAGDAAGVRQRILFGEVDG
jgi:hypothetical protein